MVLLKNFINIFHIAELRKKVLFTLGVFIVYRFGYHIPIIGVDIAAINAWINKAAGLGGLFRHLDLFSGGALQKCTLFALGIMPYITASIMMQLLGKSIPMLEQLNKEGEYGRKVIKQYTRYLTLLVSLVQSFAYAVFVLEPQGLVLTPGWSFRFMCTLSLTVGALFVMWLGEQISIFGLGDGSSMIIFAGIVARFPADTLSIVASIKQGTLEPIIGIVILLLFVIIAACIIFFEKGERKIPVQYSRRIIGNKIYGGQSTYIPFKLNPPGVMPVIFAGTMLNIPMFIASMLANKFPVFKWISESLAYGALSSVLTFVLIIVFSFVFTSLIFNPEELADNIKKQGGFIPGIRPGNKTAEYFNFILNRIGLVGAIYLAILALLPDILRLFIQMPINLSGTSLLIVVGVALETAAQLEAYLIEHRYEGFLTVGRFKSRRAR